MWRDCISASKSCRFSIRTSHRLSWVQGVVDAPESCHERVKIQILDGDDQPLKTAYLLNSNTDDVRARVYFVGAKCVDGSPKVRVSLRGDEKTIKEHARVTFLPAACE